MPRNVTLVNRAPVLTLWAAIVAEQLGYDHEAALTLGKTVAGLNAQSKGRRLGMFSEAPPATPKAKEPPKPNQIVELMGRAVPVTRTPEGLRAVVRGRMEKPESVERYLEQKFGEDLPEVEAAMRALAKAHPPGRLAEIAFSLYEEFRPEVPKGAKGWGAKGRLDLNRIRALAQGAR